MWSKDESITVDFGSDPGLDPEFRFFVERGCRRVF